MGLKLHQKEQAMNMPRTRREFLADVGRGMLLATELRGGTDLRRLVSAAALANARTFGGEDYVGFHTMMALAPAFHMAQELPKESQPLPVFKVLYRNTNRIQERGGRKEEVLHMVKPGTLSEGRPGGELLRETVRGKNVNES